MSEQPCEEFQHNGKTVKIFYDEDPEHANPRDADNLGVMLANGHRHYILGDEKFSGPGTTEYDEAARALEHYAERGKIRLFPRWCSMHLGSTAVLALGLIDHSGISMYVASDNLLTPDPTVRSTHPHDPGGWDSGLIGFIFDTAKTREMCGTPVERVVEALRDEVKYYDMYLTGQVYGYVVEDEDGDEIESCWGFLGEEYAKQEARDAAGYTCKHCQQPLHRHIGPVIDENPDLEGHGFVHRCCETCGRNAAWGGDGHYHVDMKPWDWPDGKPDHPAKSAFRHQCEGGLTFAETDQEVGSYT